MKIDKKTLDAWYLLPDSVKERKASEIELLEFEIKNGPIPEEYRWFLLNLGGGPVGSEFVNGIEELTKSHTKFQQESGGDRGWTVKGFIIGCDGTGNPMVIDNRGRVLVEDHNFGGIHVLYPSFGVMLRKSFETVT